MRQVIIVGVLSFLVTLLNAQVSLTGYILDEYEQPHMYASISLVGADSRMEGQTNEHGRFLFNQLKIGKYEFQVITAYGIVRKEIKLTRSIETVLTIPRTVKMDEVTVRASRADNDMPFSFENIDHNAVEKKNLGQDVPFLLKWSQSAVVTSDAGTGIGYTGIRIRGSAPSRTNVTINGIPLNDSESQSVFWVNLPDFTSSVQSIQIQRGVGTSVNGAGAFGASLNLNTSVLHEKPYAGINTSIGSFGTLKGNVKFGSGLIKNRWTIDGRLSRIHSNGYIDRAEANLTSGYGSVALFGNYSTLRFNLFHGEEVTYQAWNGVPAQYMNDESLRKTNTAGAEKTGEPHDNEVDDYQQTHYQLLYNTQFNTFLRLNAAAHYTRGKGFFEQYKADENLNEYSFESNIESDLIRRRWLDNHFFGGLANLNLQGNKDGLSLDLGGAYHHYIGSHFGEVIWNAQSISQEGVPNYYDNDATKGDFNLYVKMQSALFTNNLRAFVDIQQRNISYEFVGLDLSGNALPQKVKHQFFNPKVGLTFRTQNNKGQLYASIAVANKEPNRDDYTESSLVSRPQSEKLVDFELGYRYQGDLFSGSLNYYNMSYQDQLVPTGRINDVGAITRQNVDESFRRGLELSLNYQVSKKFNVHGNTTISNNEIKSFTEYIDDWEGEQFTQTHKDVAISFSPKLISSLEFGFQVLKKEKIESTVNLSGKWVGKQYLDNTENKLAQLDAYFYADLGIQTSVELKGGQKVHLNFLLRNLLNDLYSTNGWVYRFKSASYDPRPDDPFVLSNEGDQYNMIGYYPQATRNVLLGISLDF